MKWFKKKRDKSNPQQKGGGGLLGGAAKGAASGGTFAGLYGLSSLLSGSDGDPSGMGGAGGGFATSRGMGAGGSGSSNYTPSAAATSVLSDADSSDPVVRQLQDIEKVLVSIKGDTSILAAGTGGLGVGRGKNNPALQSMYGRPQRSDSDLKSFLPLLLAGLFGFFNQDKGGGADGGFIDKDGNGVDDRIEGEREAATRSVVDPKVLRQMTNVPIAAAAGVDAATGIARGAVTVAGGTGAVIDAVRGAGTAAEATEAAAEALKSGSIIDSSTGKTIPLPPELGPAANESINPDAKKPPPIPDVPDVDVDPNSIKGKVARGIGKFLGKTVPGFGDAIAGYMAFEKLREGDFTGAAYEVGSILSTTAGVAAATAASSTIIGGLAAPALAGAGVAGSTYFDYKSISRDLYKEIFGYLPEDDPDYTPEREQEVIDEVINYIKNLPADLMQGDPVAAQLEVEARPEVTEDGKSLMARSKRKNQERRQKEWDEKYGDMYNADGMMKPELVPAAKAEAAAQGTGFFGRIQNRAEPLIEDAKALGEEFKEGAERLAPGLKLKADTVELSTETAARVDSEEQATRISDGVGMSVAMNQKVQSTGVIPNTPSVNVSVAGTKTSFPQGLAELKFINDRGSYLT